MKWSEMSKDSKDDAIRFMIIRILFLAIAAFYIGYGVFFKPPCDSDAVFLACRLTGSIGDWIGSLAFIGSMVWCSGLIKGLSGLYAPAGSAKWNIIFFLLGAVGITIVWNL